MRYVRYNNFEILEGAVFSVFDLLYKEYAKQREAYLAKHKKVSMYISENLLWGELEEVLQADALSKYDVAVHFPLRNLIKDVSRLDAEHIKYAQHPSTHVDFLIFNRMDKSPVAVIEVDGYDFHKEGTPQYERDQKKNRILGAYGIPILRVKTNTSCVRQVLYDFFMGI